MCIIETAWWHVWWLCPNVYKDYMVTHGLVTGWMCIVVHGDMMLHDVTAIISYLFINKDLRLTYTDAAKRKLQLGIKPGRVSWIQTQTHDLWTSIGLQRQGITRDYRVYTYGGKCKWLFPLYYNSCWVRTYRYFVLHAVAELCALPASLVSHLGYLGHFTSWIFFGKQSIWDLGDWRRGTN